MRVFAIDNCQRFRQSRSFDRSIAPRTYSFRERGTNNGVVIGDEYFELVRANTKTENEILARQESGEQLLVKFRGQVYQIE